MVYGIETIITENEWEFYLWVPKFVAFCTTGLEINHCNFLTCSSLKEKNYFVLFGRVILYCPDDVAWKKNILLNGEC